MTTIKQKLCSKIGISEHSLKGNNLFSPSINQQNKSINIDNSKISNGEKAIKYFSNANEKIKPNKHFGSSTYQNYKIDILVPHSERPKPLITLENSKSYYSRKKEANEHCYQTPTKDSCSNFNKRSCKANQNMSNLSDLNSNLKLNNLDVYSPLKKVQAKNDNFLSGKYFLL
jgi:hypothetical protein